jgi:2-oxoacid:acceptor oxidoreductase delta subunit (pyruvate/2-ketoisovalerate family)
MDKKWAKNNKSREERPLVQNYCGFEELPPIPISFPQKGAIGKTGDWRTYRPVIDSEKCTKCGMCYLYCPEGVIQLNDETNEYEIDLDYCKGCGICAKECPSKAIRMDLEEK